MEELVATFLAAFENLDMPSFIACFASDATVFFPAPEPPARFDGRAAIQAQFSIVFARILGQAPGGPPYHRLVPEELRIEQVSPNMGLATFHLRSAERTARRTLVLCQHSGEWRIQHLHASNVSVAHVALSHQGVSSNGA
ncbi:YybH family protein [Caenimonas terrae]|uniref:YybH family protein n=1 Tax=Caenimonas terrae TaxID=696074 RepID=A0ABW0NIL2_9BURK